MYTGHSVKRSYCALLEEGKKQLTLVKFLVLRTR